MVNGCTLEIVLLRFVVATLLVVSSSAAPQQLHVRRTPHSDAGAAAVSEVGAARRARPPRPPLGTRATRAQTGKRKLHAAHRLEEGADLRLPHPRRRYDHAHCWSLWSSANRYRTSEEVNKKKGDKILLKVQNKFVQKGSICRRNPNIRVISHGTCFRI